ncbi:MAG: hypothetical protein JOZ57_02500, partial [Abitibacteriaceae bacterium]|nr:hypothetical protein [Abditibacteriaceae bacterium]
MLKGKAIPIAPPSVVPETTLPKGSPNGKVESPRTKAPRAPKRRSVWIS